MKLACASVAVIAMMTLAAVAVGHAAQSAATSDRDALRSRVEARYDVMPLKDGIGLRPKSGRIKMIEVRDGAIAIDGTAASGREVRERLGADADLVIRLSYLNDADRRAFLRQPEAAAPDVPKPPPAPAPPVEPTPPTPPERPSPPEPPRHRVGERVRVFGNVNVASDESVDGQVVAVMGSAHVDGHVSDQVVAVMGAVELGPNAIVDGDVVSVGGPVHRSETSRIGGRVTEVSLTGPGRRDWSRRGWGGPAMFWMFGGTARLFGTLFRLVLLGLLGSFVLLIVPQPVQQIGQRVRFEPLKMAAVGFLAQLLFFPILLLTIIVLAVSIIGIPFLLVLPFALVALVFISFGGFTATATVIGEWASARFGWTAEGYARLWLGVLIVLTPVLIARLFGVVGGPFSVLAGMILFFAVLIEYVVWTTGFGAALSTVYERWKTRKAPVVTPPATA